MTNVSLMKVKSIAECSPWTILQYFWPALSDNWSSVFDPFGVAVLHRFYCMYIHLWFICIYLFIIIFRIATVKTENNKHVGVFSQNILHLCRPPGQAMFVLMHSMNLSMQLHVVHYKEIQLSRGFGLAAFKTICANTCDQQNVQLQLWVV